MYRGKNKAYVRNVSSSEANLHTSCSPSPALLPPPAPLSFPQQEIPPKLPFSVAINNQQVICQKWLSCWYSLALYFFMMAAQCFKKISSWFQFFGSWSDISSLQYRWHSGDIGDMIELSTIFKKWTNWVRSMIELWSIFKNQQIGSYLWLSSEQFSKINKLGAIYDWALNNFQKSTNWVLSMIERLTMVRNVRVHCCCNPDTRSPAGRLIQFIEQQPTISGICQ